MKQSGGPLWIRDKCRLTGFSKEMRSYQLWHSFSWELSFCKHPACLLPLLMMKCRLTLLPNTIHSFLLFLVQLYRPVMSACTALQPHPSLSVQAEAPAAPCSSSVYKPGLHLHPQSPFLLTGFSLIANCRRSSFPQPQPWCASGLLLRALSNVSVATHSQHESWGRLDASCRSWRCVGLEIWHTVMALLSGHSPSPVAWL